VTLLLSVAKQVQWELGREIRLLKAIVHDDHPRLTPDLVVVRSTRWKTTPSKKNAF
jgi:hypothetical protein